MAKRQTMTASPASIPPTALRRRFVALAIPNVFANLTVPLTGLIDTALLGHWGTVADIAGVGLASVIFDYLYWSMGFLRMGTTGLTARAEGAGDRSEVLYLLVRAGGLAAAIGLAVLLARSLIAEVAFGLLHGEADAHASARAYFDARIWGAPATLMNFALIGWLLGRQRSGLVLAITAIGNIVNVALDYLFIVRWGWGSAGAGWATALSQVAMLANAAAMVAFVMPQSRPQMSLAQVLQWDRLRELAILSGDILVRTLALVTGFALFIDASAALGTRTLASNAVLLHVVTLSAHFVDGYAYAVESLAGLLRGSGQSGRLRSLLFIAMVAGLVTSSAFAVAFTAAPQPLFGLLTDHADLLSHIISDRVWLVPTLIVGSLAYILDGYFIGLTIGRVLSVAMMVSLAIGFIPWLVWSRVADSGQLLWLAMVSFMVLRTATLAICVPRTWRPEHGPVQA
ncbi:MAG: MATE family efflux transporter [Proteobacteria bacterium]|nr:MATE family efflux transporter [Pseudomonadota bacterium]